jgi:outer membrane immunogenic protein
MRQAIWAAAVLLATAIAAHGADLPERPVQPYVPPAFNWTGFYVGGNLGGARVQRDWSDSAFGISFDGRVKNGFIGGGQIGGNFQMGNIVLGGEGDFDYVISNSSHDSRVFVPAIGDLTVTSNHRWISTLTARFGAAFDRLLFYGKAGGGWVGNNGFTLTNAATGASISASSNVATGWLVGGGLEWAFGGYINTWTIRFDYAYLGLNNWTHTVPAAAPFLGGDTITASNRNIQMVKLGFNFLFNSPISSRYY